MGTLLYSQFFCKSESIPNFKIILKVKMDLWQNYNVGKLFIDLSTCF